MLRASHKTCYSLCPTLIEERQKKRRKHESSCPPQHAPPPQHDHRADDWGYYVDTSGEPWR
jgi:hypothetical protein